MKRLLTTAFAVTLASSAFAGNSDRFNDLRFDSALGHVGQDATTTPATQVTYSTSGTQKPSYPYINPYGVGPNNDSR